ncbi:MAG: hypothetical protein QW303_02600 [Nitrososphaerota archaeon]
MRFKPFIFHDGDTWQVPYGDLLWGPKPEPLYVAVPAVVGHWIWNRVPRLNCVRGWVKEYTDVLPSRDKAYVNNFTYYALAATYGRGAAELYKEVARVEIESPYDFLSTGLQKWLDVFANRPHPYFWRKVLSVAANRKFGPERPVVQDKEVWEKWGREFEWTTAHFFQKALGVSFYAKWTTKWDYLFSSSGKDLKEQVLSGMYNTSLDPFTEWYTTDLLVTVRLVAGRLVIERDAILRADLIVGNSLDFYSAKDELERVLDRLANGRVSAYEMTKFMAGTTIKIEVWDGYGV